jgi:hypothetical protein
MEVLKIKIIKKLEKIPLIGVHFLYIIRILKLYFYYKPIFFFNSLINSQEDIFKIHWIDPHSIEFISAGSFDRRTHIGTSKKGNWDLSKKKFNDISAYRGLNERFEEGLAWKKTKYYEHATARLRSGKLAWMCKNKEEFEQRLKNVDTLFRDIKENGFKADPEEMIDVYSYKDKTLTKASQAHNFLDYITVDISRAGDPLFVDGGHRLTIAKILDLDKIPVIVRVRHKRWVKFKNELKGYAKTQRGERLYQKAYHFDLKDIPHAYDEKRINLIKESTSLTQGTALDIGAYFGLNCHELEKAGFECTALELNILRSQFMEKLRNANKDTFKTVNQSIFDFKPDQNLSFNLVIALYIFHHFLKTKGDYEKFKSFLQRLDCKEMYLGVHNPEEFAEKFGDDVYKNYSPEEFSDFILNNSCLEKKELLKRFNNGRCIYKLHQ